MSFRVFRIIQRGICSQRKNQSWKRIVQSQTYCTDNDGKKSNYRGGYSGIERTPKEVWGIIKDEFDQLKSGEIKPASRLEFPRESDYVIVGAGLVGSAAAFWLKQRNPKAAEVTVIERDFGYTRASSMLSVGGIRHQFTQPENVQMSMFTTEFLRNIRHHLSTLDDGDDPPDVQFNHQGYLFLAPENKAEHLMECVEMQRELGAKIDLLTKKKLAEKFPWINLDGIEVGSYGLEGEGWFDPWSLLKALKKKNINLGVNYVNGDVVGFNKEILQRGDKEFQTLKSLDLKAENGDIHTMNFAACVNCAGPWAGELAKLTGIGVEDEILQIPLPVEPRKRFVYVVHCPDGPPITAPLTVDPSGTYFRREGLGGHYLCGASPAEGKEPSIADLDVDYEFFDNKIWPNLCHRIPAFEKLKLKSAWAGFYDYNYVDQNLIIGSHPVFRNFLFANGMSGHGAQQSLAIGRAVMELLIDDDFETIDLSRFSFERFLTDEIVIEEAIV